MKDTKCEVVGCENHVSEGAPGAFKAVAMCLPCYMAIVNDASMQHEINRKNFIDRIPWLRDYIEVLGRQLARSHEVNDEYYKEGMKQMALKFRELVATEFASGEVVIKYADLCQKILGITEPEHKEVQ